MLVLVFLFCVFFFFKQKTAYEMRISDWSSDVCSSDLILARNQDLGALDILGCIEIKPEGVRAAVERGRAPDPAQAGGAIGLGERVFGFDPLRAPVVGRQQAGFEPCGGGGGRGATIILDRSEEHTSELQSLMRISYAVFCLKKKK